MTTVVKLADPDQSYRDEVITLLLDLLAVAEKGEILSVVYACERRENVVTFGGTRIKDRYSILGFLAHQTWLINKSLDDEATDSDLLAP